MTQSCDALPSKLARPLVYVPKSPISAFVLESISYESRPGRYQYPRLRRSPIFRKRNMLRYIWQPAVQLLSLQLVGRGKHLLLLC